MAAKNKETDINTEANSKQKTMDNTVTFSCIIGLSRNHDAVERDLDKLLGQLLTYITISDTIVESVEKNVVALCYEFNRYNKHLGDNVHKNYKAYTAQLKRFAGDEMPQAGLISVQVKNICMWELIYYITNIIIHTKQCHTHRYDRCPHVCYKYWLPSMHLVLQLHHCPLCREHGVAFLNTVRTAVVADQFFTFFHLLYLFHECSKTKPVGVFTHPTWNYTLAQLFGRSTRLGMFTVERIFYPNHEKICNEIVRKIPIPFEEIETVENVLHGLDESHVYTRLYKEAMKNLPHGDKLMFWLCIYSQFLQQSIGGSNEHALDQIFNRALDLTRLYSEDPTLPILVRHVVVDTAGYIQYLRKIKVSKPVHRQQAIERVLSTMIVMINCIYLYHEDTSLGEKLIAFTDSPYKTVYTQG
jgi:hypothetical protein